MDTEGATENLDGPQQTYDDYLVNAHSLVKGQGCTRRAFLPCSQRPGHGQGTVGPADTLQRGEAGSWSSWTGCPKRTPSLRKPLIATGEDSLIRKYILTVGYMFHATTLSFYRTYTYLKQGLLLVISNRFSRDTGINTHPQYKSIPIIFLQEKFKFKKFSMAFGSGDSCPSKLQRQILSS